jgi:hypothetical protein
LRRNGLLIHIIEGKTGRILNVAGMQRRRKQLLDDLEEMTGCWKSEEEALITFCEEHRLENVMDLS